MKTFQSQTTIVCVFAWLAASSSIAAPAPYILKDLSPVKVEVGQQSPAYAFMGAATEGMRPVAAWVQDPEVKQSKNLKWGFVDASGKVITVTRDSFKLPALIYDEVGPFSGGFAPVMYRRYNLTPPTGQGVFLGKRKFDEVRGFIDKQGKFVQARPSDKAPPSNSGSKVPAFDYSGTWVLESGRWLGQPLAAFPTDEQLTKYGLDNAQKKGMEVYLTRFGPDEYQYGTKGGTGVLKLTRRNSGAYVCSTTVNAPDTASFEVILRLEGEKLYNENTQPMFHVEWTYRKK